MELRLARSWYLLALFAGALPLWIASRLPMVDLPQHLHLISVLHRLDDPTTLYPAEFALRGQLTPYLGYYHAVSLLHWLLPLPLANKAFLTAYVIGLPLSLAALLRALRRPTWPSLLALPFAYGDSFAWGFVNFCSALPLTLVSCAWFVRALVDPSRRRRWGVAVALGTTASLLFHVQAFAYLAVALPFLLLTTRAPDAVPGAGLQGWLRPRAAALLGVIPSVVLFLLWVGLRLGEPTEVEQGAPWKAWGPMLSPQNLAFKPFSQNLAELFSVLANQLQDGSDRWPLYAVGAVAACALLLAVSQWRLPSGGWGWVESLRMPGLALLALLLFFTLPFDIRGFSYYLNTRYAHLAAPLLLASLPPLGSVVHRRWLLYASVACAGLLALIHGRGYARFNEESSVLDEVIVHTAPRPRVMGLIFDSRSSVVRHPVYLHAAAELARARGGLTNFSFALTPHSPLKYRHAPPPTFSSEWRPDTFRYETMGPAYDHFLVRGVDPQRIFGPRLQSELAVATRAGGFSLVRRRSAAPPR
ncbi:MAG: hypothetical protein M3Y59_22725 [Myxococcota bacterium]|nr:hypothetical protein [Myxococcota bacterium]